MKRLIHIAGSLIAFGLAAAAWHTSGEWFYAMGWGLAAVLMFLNAFDR